MKVQKLITIDVEIAEKLRQLDNASAVVNQLCIEYFQFRSGKKKSDATDGGDTQEITT